MADRLPAQYLNFWLQVLQAVENSSGKAEAVYLLLQENLDKLDETFAQVMQSWATEKLLDVELEQARSIAANIIKFSNLIQRFPLGSKASNIEIAMIGYEIVALVFTCKAFPSEWARMQNDLGNAYSHRIRGDKAENLEQAIKCYKQALQVHTRAAFPNQWARTQNNLGNAYLFRICGNRAENLEQAIKCYKQALQVHIRSVSPCEWARKQNNLGLAYSNRIHGNRAKNLEQAIEYYKQALQVRTREAFPCEWAWTQMNLAIALGNLTFGNRAKNLEKAIDCYKQALQVHTCEDFPYDWAWTQMNLGIAYSNRIRGDWAENLEQAIKCYKQALQVYTREAFPQNHAQVLFNLGLAYQEASQPQQAYDTFKNAIKTVEFLRGEIFSGDEAKQKFAEEWNKLYQRMVEVCLELDYCTEAIEYVERSKARNLVELLATKLKPKGVPEEIWEKFNQLQQDYLAQQRRLYSSPVNHTSSSIELGTRQARFLQSSNSMLHAAIVPDTTDLDRLRRRLDRLIIDEITPYDSSFHLCEQIQSIRFDDIRSILDDRIAILEWYITSDRFQTFIITRDKETPAIWQSSPQDLQELEKWLNGYLCEYNQEKSKWRNNLESKFSDLAQILHLDEIVAYIPDRCTQLILVPHRYLHLFPLHALSVETAECLLDKFPDGIRYAPSCQLLQLTHQRESQEVQAKSKPLFAIQNPTQDLAYTDMEVKAIVGYFNPTNILPGEQATKNAFNQKAESLRSAHYAHFSCHGYFNFQQPLLSALILADALLTSDRVNPSSLQSYVRSPQGDSFDPEKCLTLKDIFALNLPECRLVTLSACETGLTDFNNTSDEYICLASGFLYAGSRTVVSSLWTVPDLATAILMIKFYENLHQIKTTVAQALNQAQIWLRNVTQEQVLQWFSDLNLDKDITASIKSYMNNFLPNEQPFNNPFYWAAFCTIGK